MAAAMVSIPLSICALRGCKIPFPNLFDVVLFSLSFWNEFDSATNSLNRSRFSHHHHRHYYSLLLLSFELLQ